MEQEIIISQEVKSLLEWEKNKMPPPVILNLRLTERCNLKCLACEKSINPPKKDELSEKKLLEILKEAAKLGIKEINIDGSGELFVRKKVSLKLIEKAKKYKMRGILVTNGTLLNEKDISTIIRADWEEMLISLDGPDAKTHDHMRSVKGAFDKTIKTLKDFNDYKKKLKTNKPEITIATVLTNKNYNRIHEILNIAKKFGITRFRLQVLQKRTETTPRLKLSPSQEKKFQHSLDSIKNLASNYGIKTNLEFFYDSNIIKKSFKIGEIMKKETENYKTGLLSVHCHLPWLYIGVREDGYVEPCFGSNFCIENIKTKTLKEIWQGELFNSIRKSIKEKKLYPVCETCCGSQAIDAKELRKEIQKDRIGVSE